MRSRLGLLGSFLFIAVLISSCEESLSGPNFDMNRDMGDKKDTIDFLALGDSYTIGQSVDPGDRWPNQLVVALKDNSYMVRDFKIIAQTGWTTSNLLTAIDAAELGQYNLVSLLIGVNNQYQRKPFDLFESEFEILLNKAIDLAGGKDNVFVVSIPDYGVTPFGSSNSSTIAMELDEYNSFMEERCTELEIPFIDITSISRMMGSNEGALAPDNLHPSGEQYTRWTEVIYPAVVNLLSQ